MEEGGPGRDQLFPSDPILGREASVEREVEDPLVIE
jgi:hypothetical protein